jgi:hypothetical protein
MDLDQDPADAKIVMNAMRMPYLMLMAADVKGYPIEGTPTVVIVDQTGVMRRRFIGYDMTGYDQMKSAIESLLPDKAKQAG